MSPLALNVTITVTATARPPYTDTFTRTAECEIDKIADTVETLGKQIDDDIDQINTRLDEIPDAPPFLVDYHYAVVT